MNDHYPITSVKIGGEMGDGIGAISHHPMTLITMGHGIQAKPIPIEKSHDSQLGNCWRTRPEALQFLDPNMGNYAISQWVWVFAMSIHQILLLTIKAHRF